MMYDMCVFLHKENKSSLKKISELFRARSKESEDLIPHDNPVTNLACVAGGISLASAFF